jgi:predicted nucleic acid-binding protein
MPEAITNTSPLVYLHRIGALGWLPGLFPGIATAKAVIEELNEGIRKGYDVPRGDQIPWLRIEQPVTRASEWLSADLGAGELAAIALGLDQPEKILLLDDALARRTAQAAGLKVWGTLRVLLEAKAHGLTERVETHVDALTTAGLWVSSEVRQRILRLAGE